MSVTYDLVCRDCAKGIWIGQGAYIYTTDDHLKTLKEFLFAHEFHHLEFGDDDRLQNKADYKTLNLE
jgi:hypothetical protein